MLRIQNKTTGEFLCGFRALDVEFGKTRIRTYKTISGAQRALEYTKQCIARNSSFGAGRYINHELEVVPVVKMEVYILLQCLIEGDLELLDNLYIDTFLTEDGAVKKAENFALKEECDASPKIFKYDEEIPEEFKNSMDYYSKPFYRIVKKSF